jgi:hypothetical protein
MLRPSSIRSGIGLAFIRVTRPLRRPPQRSADARPLVHLIQIPWGRTLTCAKGSGLLRPPASAFQSSNDTMRTIRYGVRPFASAPCTNVLGVYQAGLM